MGDSPRLNAHVRGCEAARLRGSYVSNGRIELRDRSGEQVPRAWLRIAPDRVTRALRRERARFDHKLRRGWPFTVVEEQRSLCGSSRVRCGRVPIAESTRRSSRSRSGERGESRDRAIEHRQDLPPLALAELNAVGGCGHREYGLPATPGQPVAVR
jgi:hypothetical protein